MTPRDVVGRNAEIGALDSFLDKLEDGPAALAFDGLPGIGNTKGRGRSWLFVPLPLRSS